MHHCKFTCNDSRYYFYVSLEHIFFSFWAVDLCCRMWNLPCLSTKIYRRMLSSSTFQYSFHILLSWFGFISSNSITCSINASKEHKKSWNGIYRNFEKRLNMEVFYWTSASLLLYIHHWNVFYCKQRYSNVFDIIKKIYGSKESNK